MTAYMTWVNTTNTRWQFFILARTVSEARSTRKREKEVGIKEILSGKSKEELVEFLIYHGHRK